jgi:hypothetical protein
MASLVYLTNVSPSKLGDELISNGHSVWEALSISEVLYLCHQYEIDVVVIDATIEHKDVVELQSRFITLKLEAKATAADVIWEISNLFPGTKQSVQ